MTVSDHDHDSECQSIAVKSDAQEENRDIFSVTRYPKGYHSRNIRGRKQAELDSYRESSQTRILQWKENIEKLKGGMDVSSIWESEDKMASKLNKNPVMKEWYNKMTGEEYKKMLRNRISALKSRVKKKEEEKELYALRRMKQRLLIGMDTIISRDNYEALQEFDDSSYKKYIQDLREASGLQSTPNDDVNESLASGQHSAASASLQHSRCLLKNLNAEDLDESDASSEHEDAEVADPTASKRLKA